MLTLLTKYMSDTHGALASNPYTDEIGLQDWVIEGNQIKDPKGSYWQLK